MMVTPFKASHRSEESPSEREALKSIRSLLLKLCQAGLESQLMTENIPFSLAQFSTRSVIRFRDMSNQAKEFLAKRFLWAKEAADVRARKREVFMFPTPERIRETVAQLERLDCQVCLEPAFNVTIGWHSPYSVSGVNQRLECLYEVVIPL